MPRATRCYCLFWLPSLISCGGGGVLGLISSRNRPTSKKKALKPSEQRENRDRLCFPDSGFAPRRFDLNRHLVQHAVSFLRPFRRLNLTKRGNRLSPSFVRPYYEIGLRFAAFNSLPRSWLVTGSRNPPCKGLRVSQLATGDRGHDPDPQWKNRRRRPPTYCASCKRIPRLPRLRRVGRFLEHPRSLHGAKVDGCRSLARHSARERFATDADPFRFYYRCRYRLRHEEHSRPPAP